MELYSRMPIYAHTFTAYSDGPEKMDPDMEETLQNLQKYGIMVGYEGQFFPKRHLK